MSKLPKTAVFFGYKSIKSSWLNTEAKIGSKIVFTLVACMFRLESTLSSTHLFGQQLSFSNQTVELLLPLKRKNSRIATTDLEYGALFNDYGEYTDNFMVNISIVFFVRI